nr:MAG TPA: hypothetical protein [Caudoviricetes sp.]
MKSSYEENYKALQTINLEVDKLKEELDKLNESIDYIKTNYPDGTIYDLLSSDKSIEDYKANVIKLKKEEQERIEKNAEYNEKLKEQEMLQALVDNYNKQISERKLEEERKAQELEDAKQNFKTNFEKTMSKPGLLKETVASKLLNDILYSKCLSEQEKSEYRSEVNKRLKENEEILIKEPKVKAEKKHIIKNKFKCVVAKGKEATVNAMKNVFNKSIGKVVNGVKGIYQRFCDKVTKSNQEELDYSFEYIENLMNQMEEMNAKYQEEISNLKENISNLENHISRQEDLNSVFDIDLIDDKNESKGYTDEEIMDEMSKASIYAQEEQNKKEPESKNDSAKYITKQENPEFDIDINNLKKGNANENIFDFMTKSAFDMQKEQNKKEQIDKYEKMNNEVYTGEVLPVDSEEVKNAIDIDAEKSAKAYYEHKKKEEEINRLKAQKNMYVQMIPTENNNRSMGM